MKKKTTKDLFTYLLDKRKKQNIKQISIVHTIFYTKEHKSKHKKLHTLSPRVYYHVMFFFSRSFQSG